MRSLLHEIRRLVRSDDATASHPAAPAEAMPPRTAVRRTTHTSTTEESLRFRRILADCVIEKLGIASELTAIDIHLQLLRIIDGSAGVLFLDEIAQRLRQRRAVIAGSCVVGQHLIACLCSPMLSTLIADRLRRIHGAPDGDDDIGQPAMTAARAADRLRDAPHQEP